MSKMLLSILLLVSISSFADTSRSSNSSTTGISAGVGLTKEQFESILIESNWKNPNSGKREDDSNAEEEYLVFKSTSRQDIIIYANYCPKFPPESHR